MGNLYSLFEARLAAERHATVLQAPDGHAYSYGDVHDLSAGLANYLTMALGLKKGERVAVQVDKSPEVLFLYLACLRAGLIYIPLNTAYTENELTYLVENAEPALIVCRPRAEAVYRRIARKHPFAPIRTPDNKGRGTLMDAASDASENFETVPCDKDDTAAILYTSGTTGRPKGAMMSHANLIANARALVECWGWRDDDVLLHALPVYHVHGLFVACHCVLLGGGRMLFLPGFDAAAIIGLLPRATMLMGVPTFYTRLLAREDFNNIVCRNMRLFISGSAPLLAKTFTDFLECSGHRILERYGMTETGMNTSNPLTGERLPGTVGLPLPGVEARIVDEQGRALGNDEVGQLQVKGANVFKGYWRMPEQSAEAFTGDGFFETGDLARIDSRGYIAVVGRAGDMIISGGLNVYPKEVEGALDALGGVLESAVIAVPHPDLGEAVTGVVVVKDAKAAPGEAQMIGRLKERLAAYKVPKRIVFVRTLPRNAMGKVQKNLLRKQYAGLYTAPDSDEGY